MLFCSFRDKMLGKDFCARKCKIMEIGGAKKLFCPAVDMGQKKCTAGKEGYGEFKEKSYH